MSYLDPYLQSPTVYCYHVAYHVLISSDCSNWSVDGANSVRTDLWLVQMAQMVPNVQNIDLKGKLTNV